MSEVALLEKQLADTKTLVDRRTIAQRLAANADFRKLILEEFCVNECARYAQASADPALGANERADALQTQGERAEGCDRGGEQQDELIGAVPAEYVQHHGARLHEGRHFLRRG